MQYSWKRVRRDDSYAITLWDVFRLECMIICLDLCTPFNAPDLAVVDIR